MLQNVLTKTAIGLEKLSRSFSGFSKLVLKYQWTYNTQALYWLLSGAEKPILRRKKDLLGAAKQRYFWLVSQMHDLHKTIDKTRNQTVMSSVTYYEYN